MQVSQSTVWDGAISQAVLLLTQPAALQGAASSRSTAALPLLCLCYLNATQYCLPSPAVFPPQKIRRSLTALVVIPSCYLVGSGLCTPQQQWQGQQGAAEGGV